VSEYRKRSEIWMSPKRRLLSGIFGGRVDRAPVGSPVSVATQELMAEMVRSRFCWLSHDLFTSLPVGMTLVLELWDSS
jgi:hypothetical protein